MTWLTLCPLLDAEVVLNHCTQCDSNDLDKIQNEATRIVSDATKIVSINSVLTETSWETLGPRRKTHKLVMLYNINN